MAVTISETQWEDVLWDREAKAKNPDERGDDLEQNPEDIYAFGDEDTSERRPGDWTGVDRDRRSAYLIMGALRSEGIL